MKKILNGKSLIVIGVVSYILSVISSIENSEGVYTMPPIFILTAGVIHLIFIIFAIIYLWKKNRTASILFLLFSISSAIYLSPLTKIGYFVIFIWVMYLFWVTRKS